MKFMSAFFSFIILGPINFSYFKNAKNVHDNIGNKILCININLSIILISDRHSSLPNVCCILYHSQ